MNELVSHRTIIVPQLGATGVQAHIIKSETGFKVIYGPVRASDIGSFLDAGMKTTEEMRRVEFTMSDRLLLSPIELIRYLKYLPLLYIFFLIYNLFGTGGPGHALTTALLNIVPIAGAIAIGAIVVPALLPFIPFRAFSLKGLLAGILWSSAVLFIYDIFRFPDVLLFRIGIVLIMIAIISFMSLNFTGSTTYTSLSGVKLETRISLPLMILFSAGGVVLIIIVKVMELI